MEMPLRKAPSAYSASSVPAPETTMRPSSNRTVAAVPSARFAVTTSASPSAAVSMDANSPPNDITPETPLPLNIHWSTTGGV